MAARAALGLPAAAGRGAPESTAPPGDAGVANQPLLLTGHGWAGGLVSLGAWGAAAGRAGKWRRHAGRSIGLDGFGRGGSGQLITRELRSQRLQAKHTSGRSGRVALIFFPFPYRTNIGGAASVMDG